MLSSAELQLFHQAFDSKAQKAHNEKFFFLAILNPEFILLQIYHNLIGLESNKHVHY